jgi:hypothetical protein
MVRQVTLGAYQTVRIWVQTKNKKKMPDFASLLPTTKPGVTAQGMTREQFASMMHTLAERTGTKVRQVPRGQ